MRMEIAMEPELQIRVMGLVELDLQTMWMEMGMESEKQSMGRDWLLILVLFFILCDETEVM